MSSLLSQLIYGGGNVPKDGEENETDAQPLFASPVASATGREDRVLYEEESANDYQGESNDDGDQNSVTAAYFTLYQPSPDRSHEDSAQNIAMLQRDRGMSYHSQVDYFDDPSSYISQMIYGRPDHYEAEEDPPPLSPQGGLPFRAPDYGPTESQMPEQPPKIHGKPTKRSIKEVKLLNQEELMEEEEEEDVNAIATNMLTALYATKGKDLNAPMDNYHDQDGPPNFENPFLSLPKKREISEEDPGSEEDDPQFTEDQREGRRIHKELKQLKLQRHVEWAAFRSRWKTRKLDLRQECDVGNAYLRRAQEALEPKLRLDMELERIQLEESKRAEEEAQREQEEYQKPPLYDSEDERVDLLQRLSQTIERREAEEERKKDPAYIKRMQQKEELETLRTPFAETMDYWQQGRSDPAPRDLAFYYLRDIPPDKPASPVGGKRRRDDAFPTCAVVLKGDVNQPEPDVDTYFQFPLHRRQYASTAFLHHRQLTRLAARCILRGGSPHEDRLLRALWQPRYTKFGRLRLVLQQTLAYGQNMATFLGHVWKNDKARRLVATRLGILKQDESDLPPGLKGYTMEPALVQNWCDLERQKLVESYSLAEMPSTVGDFLPPAVAKKRQRLAERDPWRMGVAPPTVGYIYLPDTEPPVPTFPLDESGLMFGPTDRHVSFRHVGSIYEATYRLTVASLINRIASLQEKEQALRDGTECQDGTQTYSQDQMEDLSWDIKRLQKQLFTFVDLAPAAAKNDLWKRFRRFNPQAEIPLVQFYRAMMAFCSFAVSGCPQPKGYVTEANQSNSGKPEDQLMSPQSDDDCGEFDSSQVSMDVSFLTINEAAQKICDFCEPHIKHNGLKAFPRIHLIYGLSTIARLLPASAAELLSAPLDLQMNRTPFDNFRRMLEHLEAQSVLVEDDQMTAWTDDEDLVRIGELEYALHRAVEIFGLCIQRDPIDVRYHEWRLGALGASLLLCSGHKLGSKALPFPSSHYTNQGPSNMDGELCNTEFRKTLTKFHEVRLATIGAFKLLLQLSRQQQRSTRGHMAVSSFWEWKQVVALVAGRSCLQSRRLLEICGNHLYHTVQWATQERSKSALQYLEIVTRAAEGASSDVRLKHFAAAVERDPNNFESWRSLATALGPLGFSGSQSDGGLSCDAAGCMECQMLLRGFAGDHVSVEVRKRAGDWWGKDIAEWWGPHFLTTSLQVPDKSKTPRSLQKLEKTIVIGFTVTDESFLPKACIPCSSQSCLPTETAWLWSDDIYGEDDGNHDFDHLLPKPFAEVISTAVNSTAIRPDPEVSPELEAVYLKLVVICHLFGITHPMAMEIIVELCRRSVKQNGEGVDISCDEWSCLLGLSRLGVDIVKVLRLYQATALTKEKSLTSKRSTKPRFSEAQREAVRDGLDRFGYGKWVEMSHYYDVLEGLSRFVIFDIYKWLVKYEGMEERKKKAP